MKRVRIVKETGFVEVEINVEPRTNRTPVSEIEAALGEAYASALRAYGIDRRGRG